MPEVSAFAVAPAQPLDGSEHLLVSQSGNFRQTTTAAVSGGGTPTAINGDISIGPENAASFQGQTLVFSTAATVTLKVGLPANFGFAVRPPGAGNASIASDGTTTLNGAGATITRTLANNILFGVSAIGVNAYAVTGS